MTVTANGSDERRSEVLDAALRTFTRFGYRKTSMDDVASEARISRPGLYFLFSSKSGLFQTAVERGIGQDLAAAERALRATDRVLGDRIVDAFDCWAGRYAGPLRDAETLIAENPDLLGPITLLGPERFHELLTDALVRAEPSREPHVVARTLISVSIGVKHQAADRDEYRSRMTDAVHLLLGTEAGVV